MICTHALKWNSKIQLFQLQKIRYIRHILHFHSCATTQRHIVQAPNTNLIGSFNLSNRYYCTEKPLPSPKGEETLKRRLIAASTKYGPIVIIVHITLSLASLGFFYCLIYFCYYLRKISLKKLIV